MILESQSDVYDEVVHRNNATPFHILSLNEERLILADTGFEDVIEANAQMLAGALHGVSGLVRNNDATTEADIDYRLETGIETVASNQFVLGGK